MQDSGLETIFIPNQLGKILGVYTSVSGKNGMALYQSEPSNIKIRQEMFFEIQL
jgi:hypothetical protein